MKLLISGNSPWVGTGYGQQIDQLSQLVAADGHDVALHANYGLQGAAMDWNGLHVYPNGYDTWGNDVVAGHADHHFAGGRGWILTLFDVWVARGSAWKDRDVACWVPVDHVPTPPKVVTFFEETGALPIAMSQFGLRQLDNAGLDAMYAPHGVDCEVFRTGTHLIGGVPARQALGLPDDAFVVGMNAANKGASKIRKGFPQAFAAFGMFVKEHPDAVLFLHTERHGMAEGVRLDRLAQACGIPDGNIAFVDQYAYRVGLSQQVVAAMYSAFDVLLAPSMGEGFGIPVVEAQACGVPVIVSDFSAQPELVGSGWAVGGQPDWDEAQGAWLHLPDVGQIVEALRCAYNGEGIPGNARAHAELYDTRLVFDEFWRPILTELERRLVVPDVDIAPVDVSAL